MADAAVAQVHGEPFSAAERALPVVLGTVLAGAIIHPRALPALMGLLALTLAGMAWLWRDRVSRGGPGNGEGGVLARMWQAQPATIGYLAFAGYCAVTAAWSPIPVAAFGKVSWLILLVLMTALGVRLWSLLDRRTCDRLLATIAALTILGSVFLAIEVWSVQAISRFAYNWVPFLDPGPNKHMTHAGGRVTAIGPWVLNRNVGAFHLLLWPALSCMFALAVRRARTSSAKRLHAAGLAVVLVATLLATMRSEHETSQIAMVVSGVVYLIARLHLPTARIVVLAGWLAANLAMLPVVAVAHKAGLHENRLVPLTGQARIILWNFTAQKFLERPLAGVGANATRTIDDDLRPTAVTLPGQAYPQRTGQHSHNFFVQTWYELGVIGALLFLAGGCLLWRETGRLSVRAQPYALAASTSAMCIAALSWGLWQQWYLSLFAIAILLIALGNVTLDRSSEDRSADWGAANDVA